MPTHVKTYYSSTSVSSAGNKKANCFKRMGEKTKLENSCLTWINQENVLKWKSSIQSRACNWRDSTEAEQRQSFFTSVQFLSFPFPGHTDSQNVLVSSEIKPRISTYTVILGNLFVRRQKHMVQLEKEVSCVSAMDLTVHTPRLLCLLVSVSSELCSADLKVFVLLVSSILAGSNTFCGFPWALRGKIWWRHPI